MGLLDGLFSDDPKQQAMMAMAMGLLGNQSGNFGQNVGHAGLLGQQAYAIGNDRKQKALQEEQQRQMRDMQMAQMKQAMEDQQFAQQQAPQFFSPGNAPADGTGPVMPPKADLSGYGMALAQRNPTMGMPFIQAGIKDNTPIKIGEGETLIDRNTYKPVASGAPKLPPGMVMGPNGPTYMPEYLQGQQSIRAAGRPQISVDNRQENAFSAEIGKEHAKNYNNLQAAGASAQATMNKLDRLGSLLDASGNTGKLTPSAMELSAAAASLGIKVDPKLPYQQAAAALSNELALDMRNPAGGAGMPGALSDSDRKYLAEMVPNLSKTPEGNKLLIETRKKLAIREQEVAKLAREYKKQNGKFDEGFVELLGNYSAAHPLFTQAQVPPGNAGQIMRFDSKGNPL